MTNLSIFEFNCNQVRVISVNGEPYFVAKDVLEAIDSTTTVTSVKALVEEGLGDEFVINQHLQTNGGSQEMLCLSEPALTFFVSRSRTELGKQLNRWIHKEVLPSIRKNGSYAIAQNSQKDLIEIAHAALDGIFSNVPIKPELVAGLKLNATQKLIPQLAPVLEDSRHLLAINTAQEFELLTPTQIGEQLGLSARKVNQLLIDKGFQVKNEGRTSRKQSPYLPTAKGLEFADLTLSTGKGNDSTSYQQLRWYNSVIHQI